MKALLIVAGCIHRHGLRRHLNSELATWQFSCALPRDNADGLDFEAMATAMTDAILEDFKASNNGWPATMAAKALLGARSSATKPRRPTLNPLYP